MNEVSTGNYPGVKIWIFISGVVASFLVGTIFGSGAIWKYLEAKEKKQKLILETHKEMGQVYLEIMGLFKRYKVKVIPGVVWEDTETVVWEDTETNVWEDSPDTITVEIDAKSRQEIFMIEKRLNLLLETLQAHEDALADLEDREPRKMDLDFIPPEFRQKK